MFFKLREAIWWIVHELEDILYPYYDRPVEDPNYYGYPEVDLASEFESHIQSSNERIERLQSEMIFVQEQLGHLKKLVPDPNEKDS